MRDNAALRPIDPAPAVDYQTDPSRYRHWSFTVDGPLATLTLEVAEDGGLRPGYKLKLNSYDLGVDIELADAVQRLRFEHPQVRTVIVTSGRDRVFCSGANIHMLGLSSHPWKVNFCKFTNETRNGLEDSSRDGSLKFLAAVNGSCAGGGYELALACDEILLVDDRSSAVSLPEVPLLGVLPGTGGLTRLTDKRQVRHDLADIFCTTAEGVRGQRAKDWRLVDALAKPAQFQAAVRSHALALAGASLRPARATGIALTPVHRRFGSDRIDYDHVAVAIDRGRRLATLTVKAPAEPQPTTAEGIHQAGAAWWPLAMARELDDAILTLRTNELEIGTWLLATAGDPAAVMAVDRTLITLREEWLVRETIGLMRRTFARLDVSARSLFALIEPGSCFAGALFELALACDRSYMADRPGDPAAPVIALSPLNFGPLAMVGGVSRLTRRFYGEAEPMEAVAGAIGRALDAQTAVALGLVTAAPDPLDWADEIRLMLEERASLSPDGLTGLEANLRFCGPETMETRIFGRLTAWQNWIFNRPNAVGERGALTVYGSGGRPGFDWTRV